MDTLENMIYVESGGIYMIYEPTMFDCPSMVGINTPKGLTITSSFTNPTVLIERYNKFVKEDGHQLIDISGKQKMIVSTYRKDQVNPEWIQHND